MHIIIEVKMLNIVLLENHLYTLRKKQHRNILFIVFVEIIHIQYIIKHLEYKFQTIQKE